MTVVQLTPDKGSLKKNCESVSLLIPPLDPPPLYCECLREYIQKKASFFCTLSQSGLDPNPPLILDTHEVTFVPTHFGQL